MNWQSSINAALLAAQRLDGGFAYHASQRVSAEPTALAAMALRSSGQDEAAQYALTALTRLQKADGHVAPNDKVDQPGWPTPLALLAWTLGDKDRRHFDEPANRAVAWLLRTAGEPIPPRPDVFGHDTTIQGWPWVAGTHSWIEPTAYAVLALRAARLADHPRTREGVRLLLDRALPTGGWNYGNTRVFDGILRPFPSTTGVVLTALHGEPADSRIDAAIQYLQGELPRIRAPFSLGWGLIGLTAWNDRPASSVSWLQECAARWQRTNDQRADVRLVGDPFQTAPSRASLPTPVAGRSSGSLDVVGASLLLGADQAQVWLGAVAQESNRG